MRESLEFNVLIMNTVIAIGTTVVPIFENHFFLRPFVIISKSVSNWLLFLNCQSWRACSSKNEP